MTDDMAERIERFCRDIVETHRKYKNEKLKHTAFRWLRRGFEADTGKTIDEVLEES